MNTSTTSFLVVLFPWYNKSGFFRTELNAKCVVKVLLHEKAELHHVINPLATCVIQYANWQTMSPLGPQVICTEAVVVERALNIWTVK